MIFSPWNPSNLLSNLENLTKWCWLDKAFPRQRCRGVRHGEIKTHFLPVCWDAKLSKKVLTTTLQNTAPRKIFFQKSPCNQYKMFCCGDTCKTISNSSHVTSFFKLLLALLLLTLSWVSRWVGASLWFYLELWLYIKNGLQQNVDPPNGPPK